eukprot:357888_1
MAATQEVNEDAFAFDAAPIYNDNSGNTDMFGQRIDEDANKETLFVSNGDIMDECQELMDSLYGKWIKGETDYVIGDWRIQNGDNIDYNGMLLKKGSAPRRMKR